MDESDERSNLHFNNYNFFWGTVPFVYSILWTLINMLETTVSIIGLILIIYLFISIIRPEKF
jgi:K+-transporting ATPase KdpF subunit